MGAERPGCAYPRSAGLGPGGVAPPAGVGGRAGRQVSAASAFGGDGAARGGCGRPVALAPRPRPPPPPPPPVAPAGDIRPGPAGRAAAARCAAAALGRPRRGELGAARRRARGPGSSRRPLAPQSAGPGRGLRPGPGLRHQAGQQHAPGERAPGPGVAGLRGAAPGAPSRAPPARPGRSPHPSGRGPETARVAVRPGGRPAGAALREALSSQGRPA